MEKLTTELDQTSQNNIKIWSDMPEKESKQQKSKDQINLEKIWGKKKWGAKSVKLPIRILVNFSHGRSKFAGFVV